MAAIGLLVGGWLICMGTWGMTHAVRSPEGPSGHWTSTPAGRRVGGALPVLVGLAAVAIALTVA